jgi:hypothetical protein
MPADLLTGLALALGALLLCSLGVVLGVRDTLGRASSTSEDSNHGH